MTYPWSYEDRRDTWEWLVARWPDASDWEPDTVEAFFADLAMFPPGLVMEALAVLRDEGREWAPRVSVVLRVCRDLRQHPTPSPDVKALPAPAGDGSMSWAEYARTRLGRDVSLWEAARQHLERREE
jgi:hypothetical protein